MVERGEPSGRFTGPGSSNAGQCDAGHGYVEALVTALGGVVWEFDWEIGGFTFVSDAAEQLLGFTIEEWMKPGFWVERLHPEDAEWAVEFCIEATRDRQDHEFEYRMIRKDGGEVWVRDIVSVDAEKGLDGCIRGLLLDITAHKHAEHRADEGESRFREVVEGLGLLVIQVDATGRVTYANGPARTMFAQGDGLVGRSFFELIPEGQRGVVAEALSDHPVEHAASTPYEVAVVASDATERMIRFNSLNLFGPNGEFAGAVSLGEDITQRAADERAVSESRDFLENLLQMLDAGVIVVDGSRQVIRRANRPAERLFGYAHNELLGMSTRSLHRSEEAFVAFNSGIADRLGEGELYVSELELKRKDGSPFAAEVAVRSISGPGGDRIGIIRDITDRKAAEGMLRASEHKFRAIVEQAPFGMHFYRLEDDKLIFTGANPTADSVLGVENAQFVGMEILEAFPSAAGTEVPEVYARIARSGGTWHTENLVYEGAEIAGAFDVNVFQIQQGEVAVTFNDVTDRRLAAERERAYLRRLSALAADLTDAEDVERRRLAEELHDRVSQALAVCMMHLRAATAQPGECDSAEIEKSRTLLEDAIRETRAITTELFPPILRELGLGPALRWLTEEVEGAYELPCEAEVEPDAERLEMSEQAQAVLFRGARELLMNVVKHAQAARATVRLSVVDKTVELTVADDGRGFDVDCVTAGGQSGFGLFSIRDRLPHLGGELEIFSEPGAGTQATICMPLNR